MEKPRAMEWNNSGSFNSAPDPQSAPELGAYEEMEISSWTLLAQGSIIGQDSPSSALHPPSQVLDSLSSFLFLASFFLQGERERRKRLGEAPKWQLQESITALATGGYSVHAGQAQSPPSLASGHGIGCPCCLFKL